MQLDGTTLVDDAVDFSLFVRLIIEDDWNGVNTQYKNLSHKEVDK